MAHDLEVFENGEASFAHIGEGGWHGLGQQGDESHAYSIAAMMGLAQADYEVGAYELQTIPLEGEEGPRKIPDVRYLYRKDNMRLLSSVGPRYTIFQNSEAFGHFQPWLDARKARLDTCGVIGQGRKAWMQALVAIRPEEVVKGDEVESRILACNTFDGMTAIHFGFTAQRVVCQNTLRAAFSCSSSKLLRVRHNANVAENVAKIAEIMDLASGEFRATVEQYRFLANKGIKEADLRRYVKAVFGWGKVKNGQIVEVEDDSDMSTNGKNTLDKIMDYVLGKGQGQNLPAIQGTIWQAYNGVNGWLMHEDGRGGEDDRKDSIWFGANAKIDKAAFEVAMTMAQAA